ncbi:MAG: peptidase domain-containing ABC transporter [Gammaproteobacteria bacterium]|nr:peptidase domain-containing ABC transporter [Gammaproteobacteria bacterium]
MAITNRLPMYLQHEQTECGYACIAMMAVYFGHDIDIAYLRSQFPEVSKGTTMLQLRAIFSELHFNSQALKVPLEQLVQIPLPAVLHWNLNHFVVLKKIKGKRYWIHDPSNGVQVYDSQGLSKCFTGVVLTVEPTATFSSICSRKKIRALDFVRCVSKGKGLMVLSVGLSLVAESAQMIQALMMQYMTDSVVGMHDGFNVWYIAIGMLLVFVFFSGLDYIRGVVNLYFSTQLKTQFLVNAMRHLVQLPLRFFEKREIGQLHLIFQAIEVVQRKCGEAFSQGLSEVFLMGLNATVMVYYSAELSMVVTLSVLLIGLCRYMSYFQLRTGRQSALNYHGKTLSIFLETMQMMMPIKAYAKELQKWTQWRHAYVDTMNVEFAMSQVQLRYQVLIQLFSYVEYVVLVCWGASLIDAGRFSLGMLIAFLSFRLTFVNRCNGLTQRILDYVLMDVELERVNDVVSQHPEKTSGVFGHVPLVRGHLKLNNIVYAYDESSEPILNNIELEVRLGEKLVITGPSGSGKTTLMKIMMGLLPPHQGEMYVDGCLLADLGLKTYRQHIACVLQADQLMSGSIRENIVFFEESIDWDWLEEVTRLAVIDEVIMRLPMKYETRLSEMGSGLSGGEKQRLLLARALYKRPKLLFLDEATSHLDTQTERRVNEGLKQLEMTQVMIAHRQETIAMADRVVQLSRGKVAC